MFFYHKKFLFAASFILLATGIGGATAGTSSTVHSMGGGGMHLYRPPPGPLAITIIFVESPTTFILRLLSIISLLISSSIGDVVKIRRIFAGTGRRSPP